MTQCDTGYAFTGGNDISEIVCDIGGKWNTVFQTCKSKLWMVKSGRTAPVLIIQKWDQLIQL